MGGPDKGTAYSESLGQSHDLLEYSVAATVYWEGYSLERSLHGSFAAAAAAAATNAPPLLLLLKLPMSGSNGPFTDPCADASAAAAGAL